MMNVFWTASAQDQLDSIYSYISLNSEEYALAMVDRITSRSIQIANHPMSGRSVPEYELPQIREVIEFPYRIIYHIKPDRIDVIAVLHGARNDLR